MKILKNKKVWAAMCGLTFLFSAMSVSGCKSDDDSNVPEVCADSIIGNTPAPQDWVVPNNLDAYPMGMFFLIDGTGTPVVIHEGDLLAAFIEGECRGVAKVYTGNDNYTRADLKVSITSKEADSMDQETVELRYYSVYYKRIYTAKPVIFYEEGTMGDYKNGYKPEWIK